MTLETRYVAELTDIASVRIECRKCDAAVTCPPKHPIELQHGCRACHACHAPLFPEGAYVEREAVQNFLTALQVLHGMTKGSTPYVVRLELKTATAVAT